MTIKELRTYLERSGVPRDQYVIQDLGAGEVNGIGFLDGSWCTYYSERGAYRQVQPFDSEAEAIDHFLTELREALASIGIRLP